MGQRAACAVLPRTESQYSLVLSCVCSGKGAAQLPKLARELAQWILDDQLPVRFQLQLHKLLWNDETGR